MDPNETLKQLRALLSGDHSGVDTQEQAWEAITDGYGNTVAENLLTMACEAEELFQALDGWISKGGALPEDWVVSKRLALERKHVAQGVRRQRKGTQ